MEYGMAAEPSALGSKIKFWLDNTPSEYHTLFHIEDIEKFPEYEVENDAFMAMTLHRIRMERQRIRGHSAKCCRWSRRAGRCAPRVLCAARPTS